MPHDSHDHTHEHEHDHKHAPAPKAASCCSSQHACSSTPAAAAVPMLPSKAIAGAQTVQYRIVNMDCPTEERLIRNKLANMAGVVGLDFNLM
ncbi:MAG: cation-transporting P-type ATPase, partial [Janthinobacterium sp.]